MTEAEIRARIQQHEAEIAMWRGVLANKGCETCQNFTSARGCALADGATPPPEVQRAGCPAWRWDPIPF